MNKLCIASLLLIAGLLSACTNIRPVGKVNGVDITRVTTRGVFSPSSTTLIGSNPAKPGEIEVLSSAHGPGFVPAVAQAGGIAAGAALLRPSRVNSVNSASANASSANSAITNGGNATATGNGGNKVPPGHVSNPSENH